MSYPYPIYAFSNVQYGVPNVPIAHNNSTAHHSLHGSGAIGTTGLMNTTGQLTMRTEKKTISFDKRKDGAIDAFYG